eukprot:3343906-Pyramimonas_sp.AAC.1
MRDSLKDWAGFNPSPRAKLDERTAPLGGGGAEERERLHIAGDPSLCDPGGPAELLATWLGRLEALLARQKEVLAACAKHYQRMAGQDWHAWLTGKLSQGARNAHSAIKDPLSWRPTSTLSSEGQL